MRNDNTTQQEQQQLYDARQAAEIKRLRDENARLRTALELARKESDAVHDTHISQPVSVEVL